MLRTTTIALAASSLLWGFNCGGGGGSSAGPELPAVTFTRVADGLVDPTVIARTDDGSGRLFIGEQGGRIRILSGGVLQPAPLLDISDRLVSGGEQGLLGLAFPPDFSAKGYFYVNYTRAPDGATVVSRFRLSADPDLADAASEEILLTVQQPFANHNGGQLAFGPDGLLYVGLGDGGSGGDPLGNGQNPATLLGSLLRIAVEGGATPYGIPPDNPFVNDPAGRDEIWALGLRNPWRFSFDRATGDLFIADVGQDRWEEIDFQAASSVGGANYGWNILEGSACFNPASGCVPPPDYAAPVTSYGHDLGCSVTGGYVYRGPDLPSLEGVYLFADFCSGRVWGLRRVGQEWRREQLADTDFNISTFGEDEAGRLYLADYAAGVLYRLDSP